MCAQVKHTKDLEKETPKEDPLAAAAAAAAALGA